MNTRDPSEGSIVRIVGVLFIVQMTAAVLSYSVILEPLLHGAGFLDEIAANSTMVTVAMLLDLICGVSVFAIAILLFPILSLFSARAALWYVGLRLTELVSFMVSGLLLMVMLKIGQDMTGSTALDTSGMEVLGTYLRSASGNIRDISLLIYCLGAWSFYGLLFRSKLVPGFISLWGLLAVALLFIEILANVFGTSAGGTLLMMPLGVNELFLGVWLMVRGFGPGRTSRSP